MSRQSRQRGTNVVRLCCVTLEATYALGGQSLDNVKARGTTPIDGSRRPGTVTRYAEELRRISNHADDGEIIWG